MISQNHQEHEEVKTYRLHTLVKRLILRGITIKSYFLVLVGGVLVLCNIAVPSFLVLTETYLIATGRVWWCFLFSVFSIIFSSAHARLVKILSF